jgi:hypothetical protein
VDLDVMKSEKAARTDLTLAIIRKPPSGARRKIKRAVFTALFF